MATAAVAKIDNSSLHAETTVRTLADFSELTKAVRDGDLATVSILCAQLFDLDARGREEENRLQSQSRPHRMM